MLLQQGYQILVVDYGNSASLQYALRGVDVIISTIPGTVQIKIIDAAMRAGVRRFVPAEFEGRPSRRPQPDPLDRGKTAVLNHLRRCGDKIESTVFVCGVLYERFAPNGLNGSNIGHGSQIDGEGDFMIDVRNLRAEIPYTTTDGEQVKLCLTSASDVGRYVIRALDLERWPAELIMKGDKMSTYELLSAVARVRGEHAARLLSDLWPSPMTLTA